MARRFLYLMITVIALQLSWSVVTRYCMHEAGQDYQHFGHHQHTLAADDHPDSPSDKLDQSKKTVHTHHSVCSHGVLGLDGVAEENIFHPLLANIAPMEDVDHPSSTYSLPPERPQWHLTA